MECDSRSVATMHVAKGEMGPGRRAMLARRVAGLASGIGLLGLTYAWAYPYTVDDAFIVTRYAVRLAQGRGYTFNDGAPTDGVTSPLWLALAVFAEWTGIGAMTGQKMAGMAATGAAMLWVLRDAMTRSQGTRFAVATGALLITSAPAISWAVAGLETGLAMLMASVLAIEATRGGQRPGFRAGAALFLIPWLRPELVPFAWVLGLWCVRRDGAARVGSSALLGLLTVAAFRLSFFGHVVPMTAAAKPALIGHGLGYMRDSLSSLPALLMALVALFGLRERRVLCLGWALAVHGLAVVLAGGDWMPASRLFVPVIPCVAVLAGRGLGRFSLRHPHLGAAAWTALLAVRAVGAALDLSRARHAGELQTAHVPELVAQLPADTQALAALDVGLLSRLFPGRVVDLGGLTEPAIAYATGRHLDKRIDGRWLLAQRIDALVLHSSATPRVDAEGRLRWFAGYPVERRVLALGWVQSEFRVKRVVPYADRYFYVVLVRRAE
jgi:hypothetical protein